VESNISDKLLACIQFTVLYNSVPLVKVSKKVFDTVFFFFFPAKAIIATEANQNVR